MADLRGDVVDVSVSNSSDVILDYHKCVSLKDKHPHKESSFLVSYLHLLREY